MKRLLTFLLLTPMLSYGQFEVGINVGATPFNVIKNQTNIDWLYTDIGTVFDLNVAYKSTGHIKSGIGYSVSRLTFTNTINNPALYGSSFTYADPFRVYYLFVDDEFNVKKMFLSWGVSLGLATAHNSDFSYRVNRAKGHMLGLHVSGQYPIASNVYLAIQIAANYGHFSGKEANYTYPKLITSFLYYPGTIGIHYRIPAKKKEVVIK